MNLALPLFTDRLKLRKFEPGDTEKVFLLSQEESMKNRLPDQVYKNFAQAKRVVKFLISCYSNPEAPENFPLVVAVCLRSGELIGHVGLSPYLDQVEIGFAVGMKHQGSGYATEAVIAFSEWGRQEIGLSKIYGVAAADNSASCRVLEKAGFKFLYEKMEMLHKKMNLAKTYIK